MNLTDDELKMVITGLDRLFWVPAAKGSPIAATSLSLAIKVNTEAKRRGLTEHLGSDRAYEALEASFTL